jgi:hypothetical protein
MLKVATLAIAMMVSTAAFAQDATLVKERSVLINPDNQPAVIDARLLFDPTPVAEWDQQQLTPQQRIEAFDALDAPVSEIVQATRCPVLRGEPDYDWCNQQAAPIPFAEYFSNVPVFVMHVPADGEAAPTTLTQSRQWYWAHYRATHPLTTTVAQVQAYEQHEAAPIGLVGTPYPPGIEQQPGGIGSDYVAQAKADRAVEQAFDETAPLGLPADCPQPTAERDAFYCNPDQQQANTAAIKEDALAAKDAAVLSAHAEAKPKRTRTRKH